ncbi:DUF2167 domain-containing protein [Nevskia ramosa]|uniref:DUF2167 domain-containing protein n=1 Tax=Nevskia ramosa TaxID=64002 RepID=UPI00146A9DA1|nr:DUF2167 domain-containing protein [Nevskia ramosa]
MSSTIAVRWLGLMLLVLAPFKAIQAQDANSTAEAAKVAWQDAAAALQRGPQEVKLRDQGLLKLPEGYGFVPLAESRKLMDVLGNSVGDNFLGLIFPVGSEDADWTVSIDYDAAGYIRDDDAREWNADDMLADLKKGTEAGNKRRIERGYPGLEITRWIEPPTWDAINQRLVWSLEARQIGAAPDADTTVNYNTYVLGREGFFEMNLITTTSKIERYKSDARTLLAAVAFDDGKRYADFKPDTDKVATYGLAALVGGVAAKKLGLLAVLGLFLAKSAKVIVLAVAGIGALVTKFLRGKKA